ncbi:MAG: peptidyl-prolyl cis-trans isomerase [Gemmatimonadota bacterium]|nr:MAG: peptidyl-prolyl cis-trans isomerase [Gemmatimonadota bacterium]
MRFLREPLLHFVVLGAALFLVHAIASDVFSTDASRRIAITESEIEFFAAGFGRQWQRPPTEDELRALVEGRVREEVLYRDALAVGLDQNDVVVRRRMVRKMELLSQDLATLADPTDQELQAFFQERQEEYRVPPRISFSHVYFNIDRRGPAAEEDARRALAELRAATPPPQRAPERGDRFMLQHDYARRSPLEVQQLFGVRFAETLFELEPGWQGPVVSGYGIHLVYVGERVESRIPEYGEVRDRLVNDYNRMRRDRANELLYEGLVGGYDVDIDEEALQRAALRSPRDVS